ncbi:DNA glycosylase [Protomyces lactucae-debilis]|uniref:DNA-(apurinic or apyrimidinic site) lyase n=1 Tax=Protomyces lactucae-debilis TaxID=2754530 RepID=A0A1Y2FDJ8_PROLT|nr:DNA glycosylase [Protomyces lactucae-debilis]ORY82000.1 DNA glycosylase [Protomyces lactucae-debilis]
MFRVLPRDLRLDTTLKCGQSFRWQQHKQNGLTTYRCALHGRIVSLTQHPTHIAYDALPKLEDTEALLRDYLSLQVPLSDLYETWASKDKHFEKVSASFLGVRMLRQDPLECLLSFICSTNNNIPRITMMVQALCREYGASLGTHPDDGIEYYDFPVLDALQHPSLTKELRELGFGYRAPYIAKTCSMLAALPPTHLHDLRSRPYADVVAALQEFSGVGPKVADCVALMSLDQHAAIPVDTHVIQIAMRDYKFRPKPAPKKNGKRAPRPSQGKLVMNERVYGEIRTFFQDLWGAYAGWAHSVLFAADLKALQAGAAEEAIEHIVKVPNQ